MKGPTKTLHIFLGAIILFSFSSCGIYKETSYRLQKHSEYIRQDGYVLTCVKDHYSHQEGDIIVVEFSFPDSAQDLFYYGYLGGLKSDRKVKISNVKCRFEETGDTLTLGRVVKNNTYIFTSPKLAHLLKKNKHLKITFYELDDKTGTVKKELLLIRHKHTELTSGKLLGC